MLADCISPSAYPSALADLMLLDQAATLDAGIYEDQHRSRLEQLTPTTACAGQQVIDPSSAACCISGLWLLHHFLDESHLVSQDISTSSGSFWHGIMHRREGDYSNAKYWFRRVGDHPVFSQLADACQRQLSEDSKELAALPIEAGNWDASAFVDMCESAVRGDREGSALCQGIARMEWQLLFDHCFRAAVGQIE